MNDLEVTSPNTRLNLQTQKNVMLILQTRKYYLHLPYKIDVFIFLKS